MIRYCILISFAFVNVLAVDLNEYTELVNITNKQINETAAEVIEGEKLTGYEYTVRRLVLGNNYSFDQINFMLTVPDVVDPENLDPYVENQKKLQEEITNATSAVGFTLESLGNKIRKKTKIALWNVLYDDVFLPEYYNPAVRYTIKHKCDIVGLALSCMDETKHTKYVHVEKGSICVLEDIQNNVRKYVIKHNEFYEVRPNRVTQVIGRLYNQLV